MAFVPSFKVGQVVTNQELVNEFKVGSMDGMRRSKATGTLVIISDHTKVYMMINFVMAMAIAIIPGWENMEISCLLHRIKC